MSTYSKARPYGQFSEYKEESSLARELPYWDFMDDLVVLGDGSLVLGFRLRGLSIETWDADQINRMTGGFRSLLNSLSDGCEISFLSELNSNFSETIDAHSQMRSANPWVSWVADGRIERLRAEVRSDELLKPYLYAFIYRRYEPQTGKGPGNVIKSFFSSPKQFQEVKKGEHGVAERALRQSAENLRDRLESNGVGVDALKGEEIWSLLFRFLNPSRSKWLGEPKLTQEHREQEFSGEELARVSALALPSPREQLVFSDLVQGYDAFFLDGFHHRVLTLKTLPEFTHSALVSRLMRLPFPHQLHVHVQVPEQSKELASLQARRRMAHRCRSRKGDELRIWRVKRVFNRLRSFLGS